MRSPGIPEFKPEELLVKLKELIKKSSSFATKGPKFGFWRLESHYMVEVSSGQRFTT